MKITSFLALFILFSISSYAQVMDLEAVDITGTVKEGPSVNEYRGYNDSDKSKSAKNNSKGKKKSQPKKYSLVNVQEELNQELDYFSVYKELSNYITGKDSNGNVTIEALDAIQLWDEPIYEKVNQFSSPQDLEFNDFKTEFSKTVYRITNKTNDPKVNSLKQKALRYFQYSQVKENLRILNENQYSANLRSGNSIARKSIRLHNEANQIFNQLTNAINFGQTTRFSSRDQFEATKLLFFTNLQTAKRVLNPYSLTHKSIIDKGINAENLSAELLDTAEQILEFSKGFRNSIELTAVEFWETSYAIVKYTNTFINNPITSMEYAWDIVTSISPLAILNSMFTNVYNKLDRLENGTAFEKGQIIGNFMTGAFFLNMSGGNLIFTPINKISQKGKKYIDEFKSIMKNQDGALRLSNSVMFKMMTNRILKNVDEISFPKGQIRDKLVLHGKDFDIENFKSTSNQNLQLFESKLKNHMKDRSTIAVIGTYQDFGAMNVVHYYNNNTKINVIIKDGNEFLSGWKLNKRQANSLMKKNHIPNLTAKEKKLLGN